MTNNEESAIVSAGVAFGVLGGYVSASPIPANFKVPIVLILGGLALFIGAFWSKYVNMTTPAPTTAT